MKRLSSWALPIILGVSGVALIIVGSMDLETDPAPTPLPPLPSSPVAVASPTPTPAVTRSGEPSATASASATPEATPTPLPDSVTANRISVPSVGIDIAVRQSTSAETDNFPPSDAAYILREGSQPGRNRNSYVFAHAVNPLFKPLWNVQIGAEVAVTMSDGSQLRYVVTEVRPNVACPDAGADPALNPPNPPLALQIHDDCDEGVFWTAQTDYERLTLQTSQGYNRNWGELVIVADPLRDS